jgi:large subunit ribosomal protein L6
MSRIGNKAITIPSGVTITVQPNQVEVKGPKGALVVPCFEGITVKTEGEKVQVSRTNDERQTRANHGLVRSLIQNCVKGVTDGYKKTLKLIGTGYRVSMKGQGLSLAIGFSHPVIVDAVPNIKLSIDGNDTIFIEGADKQAVGQVAANIRALRPPEPYKGKGIRYEDEFVRRKAGKTATK